MNRVLSSAGYDTDKSARYLQNYQRFFEPLADKPIVLLEVGVYHGGSLRLWRDYFAQGSIVGLDANTVELPATEERITIYKGKQQDIALLDQIARETAPDGFDIIIDDASHIGDLTRRTFLHLFENHLKSGGIYSIEDWGTGYWEEWPDGKRYDGNNHLAGMVGLVKELVDECGRDDITHPTRGNQPSKRSTINRMQLSHGQAIIVKE